MTDPIPAPLLGAIRSLDKILASIEDTHVEHTDRLRLRSALDELCQHRPDLRRQCERAFAIAQTCTLPLATRDRAAAIAKLKEMVRAVARACARE